MSLPVLGATVMMRDHADGTVAYPGVAALIVGGSYNLVLVVAFKPSDGTVVIKQVPDSGSPSLSGYYWDQTFPSPATGGFPNLGDPVQVIIPTGFSAPGSPRLVLAGRVTKNSVANQIDAAAFGSNYAKPVHYTGLVLNTLGVPHFYLPLDTPGGFDIGAAVFYHYHSGMTTIETPAQITEFYNQGNITQSKARLVYFTLQTRSTSLWISSGAANPAANPKFDKTL